MGYLEAYYARMNAVEKSLTDLCEKLTSKGYKSEVSSVMGNLAYVIINDRKIHFGFATVPYRWYIGSEHSGKRWGLIGKPPHYGCPITVNGLVNYANNKNVG